MHVQNMHVQNSLPTPPLRITTPRLSLERLTDASEGSRDVQLFHENWSDEGATGWSLQGATKSLAESRARMESQLRESDTWFYSIFLHTSASPSSSPPIHIGSISLRRPPSPTLPPPPSFTGAPPVGTGAPLSDAEVAARQRALGAVDLQIRTLGYALFEAWHGHGFATEAGGALVRAYRGAVGSWSAGRDAGEGEGGAQEREAGQGQGQSKLNMEEGDAIKGEEGHTPKPTKFYIEAGVDIDNPGSQRVLQKLGFRSVGMKVEPAKAWLNGAWRGPGWWIAGLYL